MHRAFLVQSDLHPDEIIRFVSQNTPLKMFALENVSHQYDGVQALENMNWKAQQGEQWLMLGPSGSGKTTLLHILAGLRKPSSGEVTVDDKSIFKMRASERDHFRGRNIGIVFQRMHLLSSLNVQDNLLLAKFMAGVKQDLQRVDDVLGSLGIGDKKHAFPSELSQGQAQRVSIARAVMNKPKLILADEPTSALDDHSCARVIDLLRSQAQACNATLVITTHDSRLKGEIENQMILVGGAE